MRNKRFKKLYISLSLSLDFFILWEGTSWMKFVANSSMLWYTRFTQKVLYLYCIGQGDINHWNVVPTVLYNQWPSRDAKKAADMADISVHFFPETVLIFEPMHTNRYCAVWTVLLVQRWEKSTLYQNTNIILTN